MFDLLYLMQFNYICSIRFFQVGATISDYCVVKIRDEEALREVVGTRGPVSAVINSELDSFKEYKTDVYIDPLCLPNQTHTILVVGYGRYKGNDYWLVKNSWGRKWGDKGYIKMARNRNNMCGIASLAILPIV